MVLYELLTGSTPLEKARLRQAAYAEIIRQIREEEPPRPSTRLSEAREALPSISAQRRTDPARLARLVRGELDSIVMKALEKDRNRRYETASGLARDIERHLAGAPVEAGRPSSTYRLRKLVRRRHATFLTAAAVGGLILIVAAIAALTVATARQQALAVAREAHLAREMAELARREAEAARRSEAAVRARPENMGSDFQRPSPPQRQPSDLGLGRGMALLDAASSAIERSPSDQPVNDASERMRFGKGYRNLGQPKLAIPQFEKALALRRQALGPEHEDTLLTMENLAEALSVVGKAPEAESIWRQVVTIREKTMPDNWLTFHGRFMLGDLLRLQKKFVEAEPLLVSGYEGLKARRSQMIVPSPQRFLAERGSRIIDLYEAWGKKDKAEEWRARLAQYR